MSDEVGVEAQDLLLSSVDPGLVTVSLDPVWAAVAVEWMQPALILLVLSLKMCLSIWSFTDGL